MCQFVVYFGHGLKIGRKREARKKNDAVCEAKLLAKYKGLVFRDPDNNNCAFTVWDDYLEFRSGRGGGWFVIAECNM
jgi:hypothetical protein